MKLMDVRARIQSQAHLILNLHSSHCTLSCAMIHLYILSCAMIKVAWVYEEVGGEGILIWGMQDMGCGHGL